MQLVGICGYARSGKDTAAQGLVRERGYERLAFADRVRQLAVLTNPDLAARVLSAGGWEQAKALPGVREALQRLGAGAREVLGEDVWLQAAMRSCKPEGRYVISDVRYPNEAEAILAAGGLLFRIVRPGVEAANDHPTETAMPEDADVYHGVIRNDGTVEDLQATIVFVVDVAARLPKQPPPRVPGGLWWSSRGRAQQAVDMAS